jgi:glutamate 5-kinase
MTTRAEVVSARRVVVKVGSSSLTTATGGIDPDQVRHLT